MWIGQYAIGYLDYTPLSYRQNMGGFLYGIGSPNMQRNYINAEAIQRVKELTGNASAVLKAVDGLNGKNAYQQYDAKSSDSAVVSVDASSAPTALKDFEIEVDELATAQTNEGTSLPADALFGGGTGAHQFEIDVDGKNYAFTVNIVAGDTNNEVMRSIANAVNKKGIGVEAWVSNDGKANTSALVFQSPKTGDLKENHFSVSDTGGGALMAYTGAGSMTQAAQDAVYTVNNTTQTAHGNDIDLGSGVKITLKDVTDKPVTVSVEKDDQKTIGQVREFVKSYNDLLSSAQESPSLMQSLQVYSGSYSGSFSRVGIERSADGSLSIDDKKLKASVANGELERLFAPSGYVNYGPSYRLSRIAQNVLDNPVRYSEKPRGSFYGDNRNGRYAYTYGNKGDLLNFYS